MNELFMMSLELMGKGMLGIFVVIFIIYCLVLILAKTTAEKTKDN
ncbi:hypothetical protein EDD70_2234 [Hydrogenoanaerobacterium saccharovorans]|uniref:Oxaloacetate decarboxylase, gamma chain n=1 Tax=Hydrogenoanaerobacterium saccharovorans TaxID=474960 RepID=A0A1H8CSW1_9FIRM|nr:hypothetical protein [Hydrogenoanaerobacterium saccharovorans]RPF43271.1 hypothetical protein EDD70_2234 [Hydrogenoanaerobacterium saccharovorans]SEM97534.1 hypothetical protein SAMN05216180_2292 [Hydrogenoanaerobacterium saccharovorans]